MIWQVSRKKRLWKTLNNTVIALLEDAYQKQQLDVRNKNLVVSNPSCFTDYTTVYGIIIIGLPVTECFPPSQVNIETMEMYSPMKGSLRRTNYQGVEVSLGLSSRDVSINAKIGYVQVNDVNH